MNRTVLTVIGQQRCDFLRWKGLYIEAEWDPTIPRGDDKSFWCLQTGNCLGPDGKIIDKYECNPARGCYKPL